MHHDIASCGAGVSQNCAQYATSSWSLGGVILLALIVGIGILVFRTDRRR